MTTENKKITNNILDATNALRTLNDTQYHDAITAEQKSRINAFIDSQQDLLQRLSKIELRLQRPQIHSEMNHWSQKEDVYDLAFGKYLRKGIEPSRNYSIENISCDQYDDAGYKITQKMAQNIQFGISNRSTIRKVAEIINVSRDSYDRVNLPDDILASWSVDEVEQSKHTSISKSQISVHELYAQPKATQQMLDDSSIDIEAWLARELIETFCDAEEKAFINGDGINKPYGILNALDKINVQNTKLSRNIHADDIVSLYYGLDSKYSPNSTFIISRDCAQEIRTMKDQNGRYIWEPSAKDHGHETLLGCPMLISAHMPSIKNNGALIGNAVSILFGDFSKAYQIIDREDIRVLRDPFTQKPYVKFYTTKRVGGMINKADAMCALKIQE